MGKRISALILLMAFGTQTFGNNLFLLEYQSISPGSLTLSSDPTDRYYKHKGAVYQPSKSALNIYTINLAYELRDIPFKVNTVDTGFMKTDFNNHRGTGKAEDAAARIIKHALIDKDRPTGKFFSEEYNPEIEKIPGLRRQYNF